MRILVTRPEREAERTAVALRKLGHEVVLAPLLRIEPIVDAAFGSGPWQAVLFTSANAVTAIAAHRRFGELVDLPAYVVGARTGGAAAAAGFGSVSSADGDLDALAALVATKSLDSARPLLYLAGAERAGDLAGALQAHGLRVETAIVYRTVIAERFEPPVERLLAGGQIDAVLHYSARSARAYIQALPAAKIADSSFRIKHFCISSEVAAPLLAAGCVTVEVAVAPNERALVERLGRG